MTGNDARTIARETTGLPLDSDCVAAGARVNVPSARALARQSEWGRVDGGEPDVMPMRRLWDGWERNVGDAFRGKFNGQRNRL